MTVTTLSPVFVQHFVDNNGAPLYLGKLQSFAAGTNTPLATYTDSTGVTQNSNPIILNFRGEANVWVPPNVAYKFTLSDSAGFPIWTQDNVVNSQLITLYGGVDTGVSNAYVLNFVANFTAYADGIVIYWVPANTNSGASTINVNGLGVVNIVNPDGSALISSEIVVNQPAQILFKGGNFELITPASVLSGTFTVTWSGFTTPPVQNTLSYRRTGNIASIIFPNTVTQTSNSNSFSLNGIPQIIRPTTQVIVPCFGLVDAGALVTSSSVADITGVGSGLLQFFKDASLTNNWTPSGVKGLSIVTPLVYPI